MQAEWLNTMDEVGQSPLTRISKCGRYEVANLMMIQELNDQPRYFRDLPTLHRAACWGFDDVILELVQDGADPDEMDAQGETPLHKAVRLGNESAARALIESGANVNTGDSLAMTPLHWAALTGNLEMVELLLGHHANVDAREHFSGGMTPLQMARLMGYKEISEMMQNRWAMF